MAISSFLESQPQAQYALRMLGLGRPVRRQFDFNTVYNEYLGRLGQMQQPGQPIPDLKFEDFLNEYPFMQQYQALSPQQRGFYPGSMVGRSARFLNY